MKRIIVGLTALGLSGIAAQASAFDLADYQTTFNATRDAKRMANCKARISRAYFTAMLGVMRALSGNYASTHPTLKVGAALGTRYTEPALKLTQAIAALRRSGYIPEATLALLERDNAYYAANKRAYDVDYNADTNPSGCQVPTQAEILTCTAGEGCARLFDLEDYATTYRMIRDAMLKNENESRLAHAPFAAAREGWAAAMKVYFSKANCGNAFTLTPNAKFMPSWLTPPPPP